MFRSHQRKMTSREREREEGKRSPLKGRASNKTEFSVRAPRKLGGKFTGAICSNLMETALYYSPGNSTHSLQRRRTFPNGRILEILSRRGKNLSRCFAAAPSNRMAVLTSVAMREQAQNKRNRVMDVRSCSRFCGPLFSSSVSLDNSKI